MAFMSCNPAVEARIFAARFAIGPILKQACQKKPPWERP